jgi:hypothetical protein
MYTTTPLYKTPAVFTHTFRLLKTLVLVLLAAANHALVSADPVTFWFSGVVDGFINAANAAPTGVSVGTPFVGRISYNPAGVSNASTNDHAGGVYSQYNFPGMAFTFTVYLAGHTISNAVVSGPIGAIVVENNVSEQDRYTVEAYTLMLNGTNLVAEPNQSGVSLALIDPSGTALNSTALPLAPPVLSQYTNDEGEAGRLAIVGRNSNGTKDLFNIGGKVSEIRTDEIVQLQLRQINASTAQLAWPLYANGYTLQTTTNLRSPNWKNVATPVVDVGMHHTVNVPSTGAPQFFRLKK